VKEIEESADFKLRESQRRVKSDVEEEWKERTKTIERRMNLDIEELKNDSIIQKKKLEESTKLLDETKRKVGLSKEDGRLEGLAENEALRSSVYDLEARLKAETNEHRKHQEDHMALAGRLASALQTTQIANAECEAAKAQANGAVSEGHTSHSALIQATQRLQQLDLENSQLKTDVLFLKKENDAQGAELRKIQTVNNIDNEKYVQMETDLKRVKRDTQAEISR
jgi:hypothetical protein